jgi:hypothetical protein
VTTRFNSRSVSAFTTQFMIPFRPACLERRELGGSVAAVLQRLTTRPLEQSSAVSKQLKR